MIKTTFGYIMDHCDWDRACEVMGWNPWMLNEGLADRDDTIEISFSDAEKIRLPIELV